MPDWLVQILIQYPIVAIIGFVAWYAHREMKRQSQQFLDRENERTVEAEARYDKLQRELLKYKDAVVERLDTVLRTEMKRLTKAVDELTKRLGG